MNTKEVNEIKRHIRRDRSNITGIYGCYVNENREIISEFRSSTGMMPENEGEKYFALLKKVLSGTLGKNLIDISFRTEQVTGSPEHEMLMALRSSQLDDQVVRQAFYKKIIESVSLKESYLILVGCDSYDVPFKTNDGTWDTSNGETFRFIICAVCPVKQLKSNLQYIPEEKIFHDGCITNVVSQPEMGFVFPAFDGRATNIYNALYYNRTPKENYEAFAAAIFNTAIPKPASVQKQSFEGILSNSLGEECTINVVQTVHEQLAHRIELHKESKIPDALVVSKGDIQDILTECGISENAMAKFSVDYDEAFGFEANVHPKNIIDERKFEIKTPDVSIKVAPDCADLIETRVIGGVKYILISAEANVEVNGVSIHIESE